MISMKTVGIKQLKAKLSEYLRTVRAGETILVTDRDEVIAELRPANRQKVGPVNLEDGLMLLAERHEAVLSSRRAKTWKGFSKKRRIARPSSAILDELRRDRR